MIMKDNKSIENYSDYHKGHRIASQIANVMQGEETQHQELDEWLSDTEHSQNTAEKLSSQEKLTEMYNNFERNEKYSSSKRLTDRLRKNNSKIHRVRLIKILSTSCAAAIIAVSFFIYNFEQQPIEKKIAHNITTGVIKSNFVKPTLVLNNGKNIDLTAVDIKNLLIDTDTLEYNRIVIPKMYNHTTTLADGTIVHLNSCSELKYPTKFIGEKREVFLSGEAFFEVTKSSKPFIVTIGDISVRVYGTKFNVNTHNCNNIQTVLVEGSVSVKQEGDTTEIFIKPNQKLSINKNGDKTIETILPERYTAWMDGFIRSDGESMTNLLNDIAKWYGIEFIYNEEIQKININASLNRKRPLAEIIEAIAQISGLKIIKNNEEKYMIE